MIEFKGSRYISFTRFTYGFTDGIETKYGKSNRS